MSTDRPLTRYQLAVLDTLRFNGHKHVRSMGGHPASLTRALRDMEQRGLVGCNLHDQWYIAGPGRRALEKAGR